MVAMNVFRNSAFSMMSLTGMVQRMDYVPNTLGQLNLFEPMPVRTRDLFVDRRNGRLSLIGTSALGSPPEQLQRNDRDMVNLRTTRLAKSFTLYAHEVEGIRATGSETELEAVQVEYQRRMGEIRVDMDLTHEYHRLGALQGLLLDADGTSVIYDYFDHFDITPNAVANFELGNIATDVRQKCVDLSRAITRAARGAVTPATSIHALAGDAFYDALIGHPNVEKTYLNWAAAADLRTNTAFGSFTYGGITWHNYRGTDDNTTLAIPTDEATFFPVGARNVFKKAMAPAEFGDFVNTLGQDVYAMNIVDRDRNAWTMGELYSYPLYFCQQPQVIHKAIRN